MHPLSGHVGSTLTYVPSHHRWPQHLQNVFISTDTDRRRGSRTGSPSPCSHEQEFQQQAKLQIPLSQYGWRQCRLIVLPSIQNYYNTHFIGLSQGLFNISEELWRRNSGYCSQYHRIGNYLTWILHDCACVTVAAPIHYFSSHKKKSLTVAH